MGSPVNIIGSHSKNYAHNSNFLYAQRGTPAALVSLDNAHKSVDRWYYRFEASSGSMTFRSRQNNGSPNNKTNNMVTCESTAGSATGVIQNCLRQVFEKSTSRELLTLAGGKFSLGFWYYTNVAGNHAVSVSFNTTTAFSAPLNGQAFTFTAAASTWQYFSFTFDLPITGNGSDPETGPGLLIDIGPRTSGVGITSWANGNFFNITQVQINPGPVAATWRLHSENESAELSVCKRYFEILSAYSITVSVPNSSYLTHATGFIQYQIPKRTVSGHSITLAPGDTLTNFLDRYGVGSVSPGAIGLTDGQSQNGFRLAFTGLPALTVGEILTTTRPLWVDADL